MVNLSAATPEEAAAEMTALFMQAPELKRKAGISPRGKKAKYPVLHWSLNWYPGEKPSHAHMIAEAKKSIWALGYQGHQAVLVIHNDRPHRHIHIVVNRVDPQTGRMINPSRSKEKLSLYAENYERCHGVHSRKRIQNNRKRLAGKRVKYTPPVIAKAWESTTNGKGFAMALKPSGHILARGNRCRYVVVDPYGQVQNPTRLIEEAKAVDIRARFSDLDPDSLPSVEEAKEQAAQWRERQQAKKASREKKKRSLQNRRNWQRRSMNRKVRPRPVSSSTSASSPKAGKTICVQKPHRSPYRGVNKNPVSHTTKSIEAPVRVSVAFSGHNGNGGNNNSGHDPPRSPLRPPNRYLPAPAP